jgi:hypothetical protein
VKKLFLTLLSLVLALAVFVKAGRASETSFHDVDVPDAHGRAMKATLIFNDAAKAIEVHPAKGDTVSIPYAQIDRCEYEYTKKHRVTGDTIASAPLGIGAVMMLTRGKSHWLEIDYVVDNVPKTYVLRMDKHNYLPILDALKAHTGIDAQVVGNANKRNR